MPDLETSAAPATTRWRLSAVALWMALAAAWLSTLPSLGQLPQSTLPVETPEEVADEPDEPTVESVAARREGVRASIAERRPRMGTATAEESAALTREIERLEGIDRLLVLQLGELRRGQEIEEEAGRQQDFLAARLGSRFEHPPPYSVAELDSVLDELDAATAAREVSAASRRESSREVERARDQLAELERQERLARDQAGAGPEPTRALRLLALEVEAARERLRLRQLQLNDVERDLEIQEQREAKLEQLARDVRAQVEATPGQLESITEALDERNRELDQALADIQSQLTATEERWAAAQEQVEMASSPGAALVAKAAARRSELATAGYRQELLQKQVLRAERLKDLWQLRFRILREEVAAADRRRDASELAGRLEDLERQQRLAEARLAEQRLSLTVVADRLAGETEGAELSWLGEQREQLEEVVALYEQELADLDRAARLVRRVRAEIGERSENGIGERLGVLWEDVARVWRFELTTADDQPITVGKVVLALFLILIGYLIAKLLSRRLGRSVLPRFGLTTGGAAALQTLVYYALLASFFLWALHVVSIPLTVFTVLGGVLAIGLGFGSQNIVNNFISGLILLAEQPIKVGDLVDVDGVFGQVERIGPRSSRIRAGDNTHVIVPNSAFLEKNVLNWTVSDDVVRTFVDVGVAYGSPVEKVKQLLDQAIDDEPGILDSPPPEVLFTDFGDNALAFRCYFWVRVTRSLDRDRFQSKLRFAIDRLFAEAGIVIAFPQRDVHLDSLSPVEVRLVGGAPGGVPSA